MHFFLPPHPLPLSTTATQAPEFFIFFVVSFPMIASLGHDRNVYNHRLVNQSFLLLHHPFWLGNEITGELSRPFQKFDQVFVLSRRGKREAFALTLFFSFLTLM